LLSAVTFCLPAVVPRHLAAGGTLASEQTLALTICERWDADVAVATVRGEIDISTVGTLSEHLGHLARKNPRRMVIDLAGVSFIDSSGLGGFVRIRKALPPDCTIVIRSPRRRIRQLFKLTGLDTVIAFE
jgi:anti-anti-sigma factor